MSDFLESIAAGFVAFLLYALVLVGVAIASPWFWAVIAILILLP